jgi:hypothetical protein
VTINGRPAAQVLGKQPEASNTTPRFAELTWRQVSLNNSGSYAVSVNAGGAVSTVTYEVLRLPASAQRARNIILFVGDGMALPTITMARIVSKGLTQGKYNGTLEIDRMQELGYLSTSGYDSLVTDSANSASAYATGHKSVVNAIGVYENNTRDPFDDPRVENIVEIVTRARGMATGLVTTSEIQDATPAAMFAHTRRRAEKQFIANQLLDSPAYKFDVIMGGGAAYFIPKSTAGSKRTDERDLLGDFRTAGYSIAGNRAEMNAAPDNRPLLGLYHPADMNVWVDREYTKDPAVLGPYTDQPALYEMTSKALSVLPNSQNGPRPPPVRPPPTALWRRYARHDADVAGLRRERGCGATEISAALAGIPEVAMLRLTGYVALLALPATLLVTCGGPGSGSSSQFALAATVAAVATAAVAPTVAAPSTAAPTDPPPATAAATPTRPTVPPTALPSVATGATPDATTRAARAAAAATEVAAAASPTSAPPTAAAPTSAPPTAANVLLAMEFAGSIAPKRRRMLAAELLARVGLADRLSHRPAQLSSGQQQRVAIARALANSPALLLAEEPTAHLDYPTGRAVSALLRELCAEQGAALLLASHDRELLAEFPAVSELRPGLAPQSLAAKLALGELHRSSK